MKVFYVIIKIILCAACAIALDVIIPFSSAKGIDYIKAHGKFVLWLIGVGNVFFGAAACAGFLSFNTLTDGFKWWFRKAYVPSNSKEYRINPTYGFAVVIFIINLLVIGWGIEA